MFSIGHLCIYGPVAALAPQRELVGAAVCILFSVLQAECKDITDHSNCAEMRIMSHIRPKVCGTESARTFQASRPCSFERSVTLVADSVPESNGPQAI